MSFEVPALLFALLLLPLLWWLLRATPPAPRAQDFPAIALLLGLRPREETPARTPWWLLLLRLAAAGLVIIGLAGPVAGGGGARLAGAGPVLIVLDNGWAAAPDWKARLDAASAVLDQAERAGRPAVLLTTAASLTPQPTPAVMPVALLRPVLAALAPVPWGTDRGAAARRLAGLPAGPSFYVADGAASPNGAASPGDAAFAAALAARGHVTELRGALPARLLRAQADAQGLSAIVTQTPVPVMRREQVLAEADNGSVLAAVQLTVKPGETTGTARLDLPAELRNQLGALRLADVAGPGAVALLDEASRRRPVGILDAPGAETPLLGSGFYLDRALSPFAEVRHGSATALLSRPLSVLVAADLPLAGDAARIDDWVMHGGLLIRFAGPALGAAPDEPLLPEKLLEGDRALGGAMSWSQAQRLAPFPPGPFAGLTPPPEVNVARQVLTDPSAAPGAQNWATLADGTPLVTAMPHGAGELVLFHVTANADWSNLPLSGLFVDMMNRLVRRAAGVATSPDGRPLPPLAVLDGAGVLGQPTLGQPTGTVRMLTAAALADGQPGPDHPPGYYGPERDRHAFNLGDHVTLAAAAPIPGAAQAGLDTAPRLQRFGPGLLSLALALLITDFLVTLGLRGLLPAALWRAAGVLLLCATTFGPPARAAPTPAEAALTTRLAYITSGDAEVDRTAEAGLSGLTTYVNEHTAAVLGAPAAVAPGADDLAFYPLIYWPITGSTAATPTFTAALNDYMRHGGIVVIDTRGGGDFSPGSDAALKRAAAGLDIPALAPLTNQHVLGRAFYLLSDFPGRYEGGAVWVQQAQDRGNDSVSPVIIGSADWAAAWAVDETGKPIFATIPGGPRQRTLALRFGVNMVMYALTGNYKGDQVHVPAILQRLGQ